MPTKTKTSPSGLTSVEKKELERRGFFVKDMISNYDFFRLYIIILGYFYALFGIVTIFSKLIPANITFGFYYLFGIGVISLLISTLWGYLFLGKLFFITDKIFAYTKIYNNLKKIPCVQEILLLKKISFSIGILSFILVIGVSFFLYSRHININISSASSLFLVGLFPYIFRQLVEHFHPLYAFGNLGSKIQSLTPRITEESEKIEKEFSTDMNFRTLSDSFDTLSTDFSKISSYVIKLEQIEQKANKGNLFDSQKYIGSLREDIVKPLTTLRSFLEKKKTELEEGQQEMKRVRVRVGGSGNGGAENLELQSKRSEPLREELTENIGKLDIMIEKFGKI